MAVSIVVAVRDAPVDAAVVLADAPAAAQEGKALAAKNAALP